MCGSHPKRNTNLETLEPFNTQGLGQDQNSKNGLDQNLYFWDAIETETFWGTVKLCWKFLFTKIDLNICGSATTFTEFCVDVHSTFNSKSLSRVCLQFYCDLQIFVKDDEFYRSQLVFIDNSYRKQLVWAYRNCSYRTMQFRCDG